MSRPHHAPARVPACALAAGIVVDRFFSCTPELCLIVGITALTAVLFLLLTCSSRTRWLSAVLLTVSLAAAGGARHHLFWWSRPADNILHYASAESSPVRLRGLLSSSIVTRKAEHLPHTPPWMQIDHSLATISVTSVADGFQWLPASGFIRLDVEGHLVHVNTGDEVEVLGHLSRAAPPRNPGDYNFTHWLRSQSIDASLRCEHPAMVTRLQPAAGLLWSVHRMRASLRSRCESVLTQNLSTGSRGIALSILLGDRSELTDDLRDRFTQSGTMHLLAISGLHVGLLLGMVFIVCRFLNLTRPVTAAILLTTAFGYAAMTEQQPSVLRATLLTAIFVFAYLRTMSSDGMNSLCLCAALLMLWQPAALFNIGAQLSFLAVGAIIQVNQARLVQKLRVRLTPELPLGTFRLHRQASRLAEGVWSLWLMSGAVWLVTTPLTMSSFHLLAPVGIIINILLIPYTGLVLGLGFLTLGSGLLLPELTPWIAPLFESSLNLMLKFASWGSHFGFGHTYLPGLPEWWVIGFYISLMFLWRLISLPVSNRVLLHGMALWVLAGMSTLLFPVTTHGLRCVFLSVGHGSTTVIELPGEKILVFDNGTFGDGRRASRALENYLWSRGRTRIDAVMVSHSDMDHFSGVRSLIETLPIGAIYVAQSFLDFQQESVRDMCDHARQFDVPIRLIQAGDRLDTSIPGLNLQILHPAAEFRGKDDNSNSVVMEVSYAGRRVLLTGDLEGDGGMPVQEAVQGPFDVLCAPHHGAKSANPRSLYSWARPSHVIISGGTAGVTERIQEVAGEDIQVLNTFDHGAILVEVSAAGELTVQPCTDRRPD